MESHIRLGRLSWEADTVDQFIAIENRLIGKKLPLRSRYVTHLQTDYSDAAGVRHFGYTAAHSRVIISSTQYAGRLTGECVVVCKEGYLSLDEALGSEWIPSPDEIRAEADRIRKENIAAGGIRQETHRGIDLGLAGRAPSCLSAAC